MYIYLLQPEPFLICKKYGHISLSGENEIVNCSNHYFVKCTVYALLGEYGDWMGSEIFSLSTHLYNLVECIANRSIKNIKTVLLR